MCIVFDSSWYILSHILQYNPIFNEKMYSSNQSSLHNLISSIELAWKCSYVVVNILESTASASSDEACSNSNVSKKIFIALFCISLVANVVLWIIIGFLWKDRKRSVKLASTLPCLDVSCQLKFSVNFLIYRSSLSHSIHVFFSISRSLYSPFSSIRLLIPYHLSLASLIFSIMSNYLIVNIFIPFRMQDKNLKITGN